MTHYKLTVGSTEIEDDQALSIVNVRPENNVSSLQVTVGDWQSKNYSDLFDVHTTLQLDLKSDGRQSYTTVFNGLIHGLKPSISGNEEDLIVQAWGHGIAFSKTRCNQDLGAIVSAALDTPEEILDYIIANHVDKRFGAAGPSTQWGIDTTDINAPHADFTINFLNSRYLDNFTLVNQLCDLINAHANITADKSVHWMVDTDKHFRMKEIDADAGDAATKGWYRYYGGTATTAIIKEGVDNVVARGFHKHIDDYANHILVAAGFRKPGYDYWTEDGGPAWVEVDADYSYSAAEFMVGSHSLLVEPNNDPAVGYAYYPAGKNANWDLSYIGSSDNVPSLDFYIQVNNAAIISSGQGGIILFTDMVMLGDGVDHFFYTQLREFIADNVVDEWEHVSLPVGPYYANDPSLQIYDSGTPVESTWHWNETGAPDWTEIDGIMIVAGTVNAYNVYVDDLHFTGRIVRSCYDTTEITATNKERQHFIRMDHAVDDTTIPNDDDAGMAALIAVSELYRRTATPTVGTLSFPLKEDMLPGQTLMVYSGLKADKSTFRWSNLPMRVKELRHIINAGQAVTSVQVTSDVTNTFAPGVPSMWGRLLDSTAEMNQGQANNLKMSGVDNKIPRLGWDPT